MQFTLADYNNRQQYLDAINDIKYRPGTTNTADALNMLREQGTAPRVPSAYPNHMSGIPRSLYPKWTRTSV